LLQMWHAVCPVLAQMWEGIRLGHVEISRQHAQAKWEEARERDEKRMAGIAAKVKTRPSSLPPTSAPPLGSPSAASAPELAPPPAAPALALADSDSADRLRQVRASALNVERETVDAICKLSNPPLPVRDVLVCIRRPPAPCACRKTRAVRHAPWHWSARAACVRAVLVRTQPTARPAEPGT
jgi:hypothetical protein